ncbi:DUF3551 domain-containing protein [Afipia broomeae]|uniref:DUF3551 domain-containing protein n=1 Tax=Afipia broomeae TaxID=56946 RepID=UPI0009FE632A|nr:DUF3551 domain-containing protein [Afipia broomeae]
MKPVIGAICLLSLATTGALAEKSAKRERVTTGQAGGYAYCLRTAEGPGDCNYQSYAQCQAALSGIEGTCVRNAGPR